MGRSRGHVGAGLGRLLLVTVAATYVLLLLGIYTAATGTGLTCAGRWPLCDGAVFGLFPANWPSFVEWFHRLVAMVTGLLILGSTIASWRARAQRRVVGALGLAVVLVPVQVWAGAQTVLTYEVVILTTHFLLALVIYTLLLVATTWAVAPSTIARRRLAVGLGFGLLLTVPFALLGPRVLVVHTGGVQAVYYGLGLLLVTLLVLAASLVHRVPDVPPSRRLGTAAVGGATAGAVAVKMLAGRLTHSPTIQFIDWAALVVIVIGLGVALALLAGPSLPGWPWDASRSVDTRGSETDR